MIRVSFRQYTESNLKAALKRTEVTEFKEGGRL